ncbi:MAG: ribosome silencing factor [Propionibacteriaceae bacterium]|nr:ribosome silencing factor [Propionibacteriaceae bacterium]
MAVSSQALRIAEVAVLAAQEKLGQDILVVDVSEKLGIAEVFVVISASNERQLAAIVEEIESRCSQAGIPPARREGERDSHWVLLDGFDTIVHVQHVEARSVYGLDRLWKDCPSIDLGEVVSSGVNS